MGSIPASFIVFGVPAVLTVVAVVIDIRYGFWWLGFSNSVTWRDEHPVKFWLVEAVDAIMYYGFTWALVAQLWDHGSLFSRFLGLFTP